MDNMRIYNAFRITPKEALREITEGKLKGKSDINPMWRLQMLTEQFGPIGFGWNYKVTRLERIEVPERKEIMCFVDIELRVKEGDKWSEPIYGTGGSMLVENFSKAGIKSNDDGYKMALTDAISVACKQLGMSADVYWAAGETKYNRPQKEEPAQEAPPAQAKTRKPSRRDRIDALCKEHNITMTTLGNHVKALQDEGKVVRKATNYMSDVEFDTMMHIMADFLKATAA